MQLYQTPADKAAKVKKNYTLKGTAVKVGAGQAKGTLLFDSDTLRYSAGWLKGESGATGALTGATGAWNGFLNIDGANIANTKGGTTAVSSGDIKFTTPDQPGWSTEETIRDPRAGLPGPIPTEMGRYSGLYLNGDQVVLSYTVAGTAVLDLPGLIEGRQWGDFHPHPAH